MNEKEFKTKWIEEIKRSLKSFPKDFISKIPTRKISLPGKTLVSGSEFFGSFEITDLDSKVYFRTENKYKLKYILYANRELPSTIDIPIDETAIKKIVKNYEQELKKILTSMESNYKNIIPSPKAFNEISNSIFYSLNLHLY